MVGAARSGERFRFVRALGAGGMGVVELVHDVARDQEVARKRILDASPEAILRFKREFRAIESLRHPNLVALYEMGEDERGPYFTMEHVPGRTLLAYCAASVVSPVAVSDRADRVATETLASIDRAAVTRTLLQIDAQAGEAPIAAVSVRPVAIDEARVRSALAQIVEALRFLHAHAVVHCDFKPSNVLVAPDGTVKLLDFGVVAEMRATRRRPEVAAGTLEYMAPERLRGEPATPAVDAYALGVVLFEMLAGRRPFEGTASEVVAAHLHREPPRLEARDLPAVWSDLCEALLRKDPARRATLDDVATALGLARSSAPREGHRALVGRETVQQFLLARWDAVKRGAFDYVLLTCRSGIGKTALATWLADECAPRGAVVLRGRGRPTEKIGFNLVDGAIDDLSRVLAAAPWAREIAELQSTAARSFPVLAEVEPRRGAVTQAEVFGAIAGMLGAVAAHAPVLVVLDDLQWADADSLALLDEIIERAPARVMLAITSRMDVTANRATAWAMAHAAQHERALEPLADAAIAAIVNGVARAAGGTTPSLVSELLPATGGLPALAEIAGRVAVRGRPATTLSEALSIFVQAAPPLGRRVLAAVVAYDDWLAVDALGAILGENRGAIEEALGALERDALVRVAGEGDARVVDVYHDTVRTAALADLDAAAMTAAHASLVAWLARDPRAPEYRLVRHLHGAGDVAGASRLARRAAIAAEAQRAYAFAAEMYAVALLDAPDAEKPALLRARGSALERVGSYADAARAWSDLRAVTTDRDEALDAALSEANCRLSTNEIALGYRLLDETLVASGRPSFRDRSLLDVARFVIGPLRAPKPIARARPFDAAAAEREVTAAQVVGYFDPIAGLTMLSRARRAFLARGAGEMAAWCELTCAYLAYFGAARAGRVSLAERYRRAAEARIANGTDVVQIRALSRALTAIEAWRRADWSIAQHALEDAIAMYERAGFGGSHAHLFMLVSRLEVELWKQDPIGVATQARRLRSAARGGEQGAVAFQVKGTYAIEATLRGDFAAGLALAEEARKQWPKEPWTVQRVLAEQNCMNAYALVQDARAAWGARARLLEAMGRMGNGGMYAAWLYGALARVELLAIVAGLDGTSWRRMQRNAARWRTAPPVMPGVGARTEAYAAEVRGDLPRALALLVEAEQRASAFDQTIDAATARYQRGRIVGGDEGAQLQRSAHDLLVGRGGAASWLDEWRVRDVPRLGA